MLEGNNQGVTITLREIYDTLNGLDRSVKRLEQRIIRLEEKTSLAAEAEKRSRDAIKKSEDAFEKAEQALKMVKNREAEKKEYRKIWLSAILSSTIPWALTIIAGMIYLVQKGGI